MSGDDFSPFAVSVLFGLVVGVIFMLILRRMQGRSLAALLQELDPGQRVEMERAFREKPLVDFLGKQLAEPPADNVNIFAAQLRRYQKSRRAR